MAPGSCLCLSDLIPSSTRVHLDGRASPYQSVVDRPQLCIAARVKKGAEINKEVILIFSCLLKNRIYFWISM